MPAKYLDHKLECRFAAPSDCESPPMQDLQPPISCADCGKYLGTWDELQTDFERQGGIDGMFRLAEERIKKLD